MELKILNDKEIQIAKRVPNKSIWQAKDQGIAKAQARLTHQQDVEWLEKHRLKWSTGQTMTLPWKDWQAFKEGKVA